MTFALYATIWAALALFAAGEAGKRSAGAATTWPWRVSILGVLLALVHVPLAFAARYDWSHDRAIVATAARTAEVYGLAWGGGVFVNYAFLGLWLAELIWWGAAPRAYAARSGWVRWTTRVIYAIVIFNAAVVFASPAGRFAGFGVMSALIWAWRPADSRTRTLNPEP